MNSTHGSAPVDGWRSPARLAVVMVALLITIAAFSNGIPGQFVYDDDIQIVRNPYVQEARYYWTGLTSDVWAFKGERERAWSNYWRPMFVLWLIVNHALFGLDPAGWHVTNILLHAVVVVLAAEVLRRLRVRPAVAGPVVWVFAAHPVHVESVTWISGSPDLLVGAFLLGSYAAYLARRTSRGRLAGLVSLLLYSGATLCKEVSVLYPGLIFVSEWSFVERDRPGALRLRRSFVTSAPYLAIAVLFLISRTAVLGMVARSTPWASPLEGTLLSVPAVLLFYLRQALWPLTLGPAYPLRAVEPGSLGLTSFVLPLLAIVAAAVAAVLLWRRGAIYRIGLTLFLLPLAPAMNIAAFLPEQIVHDRYLYLPLLGLLIVLVGAADELIPRRGALSAARVDRALWAGGLAIAVGLGGMTFAYNRAWLSNTALWERGVEVDPHSSHTLGQLGNTYRREGRTAEAKRILQRALDVNPNVTQVMIDWAILAIGDGRYAEAEQYLRRVLESYPTYETALDQLGVAYEAQGRLEDARRVFTRARGALPYRRVKYTLNVAVLERRLGRSAEALAELESIREALAAETDPDLLRGYYFLGLLYHEAGRTAQARSAYQEYLRRTASSADPEVRGYRARAQERMTAL